MNFTKQQMQAIWFIVLLIGVSSGYRLYQYFIWEPAAYDFSETDADFRAKYDSILSAKTKPADNFPAKQTSSAGESKKIMVDINHADIGRLTTLPRIGPKIAARIIEYRKTHGPFLRKEDLMKVKGIGKKTFENLESQICLKKQ